MPVLDIDGARATIRLNRPKHLNRLQPEDLDALIRLFDRIEADPALRVLVLTGTGRAFSSGSPTLLPRRGSSLALSGTAIAPSQGDMLRCTKPAQNALCRASQ